MYALIVWGGHYAMFRKNFDVVNAQKQNITYDIVGNVRNISRGNPVKCLAQGHNKRTCRPISTLTLLKAER